MIKTIITAIIVAISASASFAGDLKDWKNHTCVHDLRGLKDTVAFIIDRNGDAYEVQTFQRRGKYKVGEVYVNDDGTCGVVNPWTGRKHTPNGYRKGSLHGGQFEIKSKWHGGSYKAYR